MPALAARDQEPHRRRDDQPEPVQVQTHRDWQEQARGPCLVRTQRAPVAVQVPVHQVGDDRHAHEEEERDPQDAVPKVQRPALAVRLREVPSQGHVEICHLGDEEVVDEVHAPARGHGVGPRRDGEGVVEEEEDVRRDAAVRSHLIFGVEDEHEEVPRHVP